MSFTHSTKDPERMTVDAVLDGVNRMLERIMMQEAPEDPVEKRTWKLAFRVAQNALCRGEWQR